MNADSHKASFLDFVGTTSERHGYFRIYMTAIKRIFLGNDGL